MDDLSLLASILSPGAVTTDPAELMLRAHDSWALTLLRRARGERPPLPSAVLLPTSTEEVAAILAWAARTRTVVVPRGGGSGVCGGVQAAPGWVVLDISRMDQLLELDHESQVVGVQAGMPGDRLEAALQERGLTLGHYPQSIQISTVGGWIAASSTGQASEGYGAIEDRLLGVTAVLAGGEIIHLKPVPRSAAGPDLRRLLVGSEGTLAVVTEAVLSCSTAPSALVWEGYGFPSFDRCMVGLRSIIRSGAGPTVVRGYDEVDSVLTFGALRHGGGCAAIVGFRADLPGLPERVATVREQAHAAGAGDLGAEYGRHWWEHRNDAVGLYQGIMGPERRFGTGVVVDTMEVAGLWGRLPDLYRGVRAALVARSEAVSAHLSHVHPSGSSIYFTFLVRGSDDRKAEGRYLEAWEEGMGACVDAGGTITHHHGVGRLKARFLERELGKGGIGALRRIKQALDPMGILNPGSLLLVPPGDPSSPDGSSAR